MEAKTESFQSLKTTALYDTILKGDDETTLLINMLQDDPLILDRCMIENSSVLKQSPLHVAACMGHLGVVKTLLEIKPNMCFALDQYGRNPIHVASIHGHFEVLLELISASPRAAREQTNKGETYLHLWINHGHQSEEALEELLDITDGELLNAKDSNGDTVLHYAVRSKQPEMVELILKDKRININAMNKDKLTALDTHMLLTQHRQGHRHELCLGKVMNWKDGDTIGPSLEDNKALRAKDALKLQHKDNWVESKSNGLMVVASLIATMAFTLGISPPGGFWQDPDKWAEFHPGSSILYATFSERYTKPLLVANAIALGSSLSVILLLISGLPNGRPLVVILMVTMWVAVTATTMTFGITIYLTSGVSKNFARISIYIWVGLVSFVILAHLFLIAVKFIKKRRSLRCKMIKSFKRYTITIFPYQN